MSLSSNTSSGAGNWLVGAVKNNPEGLLLLAAGCALLLRSQGASSEPNPAARRGDTQAFKQNNNRGGRGNTVGSGLSDAAQSAGDYVSEISEKVMETASGYASSVSSYADDVTQVAAEHTGRFARQTQESLQDTVSRVVQAQPLAVALVGMAAGAAVAAAFPTTDLENRTLGATGERLRDAAGKAGHQLKDAAAKAGQRLADAADDRGLNTEGFKEVARDVGEAFSGALDGESSNQTAQMKSPNPQSKIRQPAANQRESGKKGGSN